MDPAVTYLFVPGNRPQRFDKALASGADCVVLDLEDAVVTADKALARNEVARWLGGRPEIRDRVAVRINACASEHSAADLDVLRQCGAQFAMLAKAESAADIGRVGAALVSPRGVLALVESARGVACVDALAASPACARLVFGTLDYAVDLGLSGDERGLAYPAARMASASKLAGIAPPVWGVTPAVDDNERLLADFAFARAFGFTAKLCIHPRQVEAIRCAVVPTAAEVAWATRVVEGAAAGRGVVVVDGRMVDAPVVLQAQAILERAR
ncbi:MAG: CoA ester lyase [Casimicrobiaceae bacterium]